MDEHVTLARQMEEEDISGQIILFNRFTVKPGDVDGFLKAWTDDATLMKQQPGLISTQLHRGLLVAPLSLTKRFGNLWQHRNAVNKVGVRSRLSNYPDSTIISPHLFRKVAVHRISED